MPKDKQIETPLNIEFLNKDWVKQMIGYKFMPSLFEDFYIAESSNDKKEIRNVYERALKDFDGSYEYIFELYMVLQLEIFKKQEKGEYKLLALYCDLLSDLDEWVKDHWSWSTD